MRAIGPASAFPRASPPWPGDGSREAARSGIAPRASIVLDEPGKYLTAIVGRLVTAGTPLAGPPTLTAWSTRRLRSDATATLAAAQEIVTFFTQEFGPCPYSFINLVFTGEPDPRRPQPPRHGPRPEAAGSRPARASGRSRELQRHPGLLPGPRARPPVVGPGGRHPRTIASAGSPKVRPSTRPPSGFARAAGRSCSAGS